jgi:hypothetical protein
MIAPALGAADTTALAEPDCAKATVGSIVPASRA